MNRTTFRFRTPLTIEEAEQLLRKIEGRDPNSWIPREATALRSGVDKLRDAIDRNKVATS